jgi:uncharacterized repeat protein (TIGR01451 family)
VRDRVLGTTARVSVSTAGEEGNSESVGPKISDDGLVVAFQSNADNLVPEDTGPPTDIFVNDRRPAADLKLAIADTPDPVTVRAELTYTVTVTNGGPAAATEVVLTDPLPADALFVSASATQGSCRREGKSKRDGVLTCELGGLAAGASTSVTIVVTPARAGELSNTASVTAREPDPNRGDNRATATTTVS